MKGGFENMRNIKIVADSSANVLEWTGSPLRQHP